MVKDVLPTVDNTNLGSWLSPLLFSFIALCCVHIQVLLITSLFLMRSSMLHQDGSNLGVLSISHHQYWQLFRPHTPLNPKTV